jgi:hypothetical protein
MKTIFFIIYLLIFIPLVVLIFNYKYLTKSLKIILYLLAIGFLFNSIEIILASFKIRNVPLFHLYTVIEFVLISLYFYFLTKRDFFKKIIRIFLVIFFVVVVLNKIFLETIDKLDNYTLTIESIFLLILSSIYLTEYLSDNLIVKIRDYKFLLAIGFMIYFGGNLFVFALSNEFDIWLVHNILLLLLWSIYTLAIIWQRYHTKYGG